MAVSKKILAEHQKLCAEVLYHRCLYYVFSQPVLTDFTYDELEDALKAFEKKHGIDDETSPTQTVGSDLLGSYPPDVQARAKAQVNRKSK